MSEILQFSISTAWSWFNGTTCNWILCIVCIWAYVCYLWIWATAEQCVRWNSLCYWIIWLVFISTWHTTNAASHFSGGTSTSWNQMLWQNFGRSRKFQKSNFSFITPLLWTHIISLSLSLTQIFNGAFSYFMTMRQFIKWTKCMTTQFDSEESVRRYPSF